MKNKTIFFLFSLIMFEFIFGQNMVINSSFEKYNTCPNLLPSNMGACFDWQNPNTSSPDYFHICAPSGSGFSTPNNAVGWQQPKDSGAYVGFFFFDKNNPSTREYVTGQLIFPLSSNVKYYVSFYANLVDLSGYSISKIGAYFTSSSPFVSNPYYWPVIPQVEYSSGNISDTMNWVLVTDTFTATGGEQYITIGNFRADSLSDTLHIFPGWGMPAAYYLIDAIKVIPYDQVGFEELKNLNNDDLIYPNPALNETEIVFDSEKAKRIIVTDISGKKIYEYYIPPNSKGKIKHKIDLNNFAKGLYFVSVQGENFSSTKKLIRE